MAASTPEEAPIANAAEAEFADNLFRMWFGAYGSVVYVWADNFESAFEELVEYLDDEAPGVLVNLTEDDIKAAAKDEGVEWREHWPDWDDEDFQRVVEAAEADLTVIGHTTLKHGQYIPSWEWGGDDVTGDDEYDIVQERSFEEASEDD